uniref:Uncharacterized protein n=1 Tax=Hyaloperonospora arabidopsidis (strain Emoy2) TaxID=559515 RepID=M4B7T2_HYAAE
MYSRPGSTATMFLKTIYINKNRRCKVKKIAGNIKTYACSQDGCLWEVRVTRERD